MSDEIVKIAIVNDALKKIVNVVKYRANDVPQDTEDLKYIPAENWHSPNKEYNIVDGIRVQLPPPPLTNEEKRLNFKIDRNNALNNLTVVIDGMEFQTRPSDLANFQVGIDTGETEWVLADNSVATVTTEQLQSALNEGIAQGKAIWAKYRENIKTLTGV